MLPGVAVMESPSRQHTSTGSSTIIRASETESTLHDLDAVHSIPMESEFAFDMEDATPFGIINHTLLKSPMSIAPTLATATSTNKQQYRVLGTTSLVAILYLSTCGGPAGSEPLMSIGGPLLGLVGIAVYVIFCYIPIALMVTELCCAFPENGGYAVWVMTAFGPFWGFQVGYWSWIASLINNSLYPRFIYWTIMGACGVEPASGMVEYLINVVIAVILASPPFIGVRFVGFAARFALSIVLGIALVFCIWGFADGDHAWFRLKETRSGQGDDTIDWYELIHKFFWSFDGLHWISMIGGEVVNPARTYPRVLGFTVLLTTCSYLFTALAAVSANKMPWRKMFEDTYPDVAQGFAGVGLSKLVVVASIFTLAGLFSCTVFLQSFLIQGMAQSRLLPGALRRRNARSKSPQFALLVGLGMTILISAARIETMLNMANAFSCSVQVVIVLTILQLRRAFPYLPRPVRIPGNTVTLVIILVPAMSVFLFAIISNFKSWARALVIVAFLVPGLVYPQARQWLARHRECC